MSFALKPSSPVYITCDPQPLLVADWIMEDLQNGSTPFDHSRRLFTHHGEDTDFEPDCLDYDVDELCLAMVNLNLGDDHGNLVTMMEVDGISYALGRLDLNSHVEAVLSTCQTPMSAELETAPELIRPADIIHPLDKSEVLAPGPDSTEATCRERIQKPDSADSPTS